MHMGAMAINGVSGCANLIHIVLNNEVHDSVGGQPTVGGSIDFLKIAEGCAYSNTMRCRSEAEIKKTIEEFRQLSGPSFLEIPVFPGARKDLGRPTVPEKENKRQFMDFLKK